MKYVWILLKKWENNKMNTSSFKISTKLSKVKIKKLGLCLGSAWARIWPKKLGSTQPQNIDYFKERKEDKHMQLIVSTFANLNFTLFLIFDLRNSRHKFYGLYFVVKSTIVLTVFLKTFLTRTYYVCMCLL